tara:strand:+ start:268 stop:1371 length:1104 start_codon:yes stop_codon:yes gene_type:complete
MACLDKNAAYGKKGILLTLGLIFVSLTILAFANVIITNSETSENRIKESVETERLYALDMSISNSVDRLMKSQHGGLSDFSLDYGNITLNTFFLKNQLENETNIQEHLNIFADRTLRASQADFFDRRPLLDVSDSIAISSSTIVRSSKFYLDYNRSIYIEYFAYPINAIYVNGINPDNTKSIDLSFSSSHLPLKISKKAECVSGSENCISMTITANQFDSSAKEEVTGYDFEEKYGGGFAANLFNFNFSSSNPTKNYTVAVNWLKLEGIVTEGGGIYDGEATEGLLIIAPITSSISSSDYGLLDGFYQFSSLVHEGVVDENLEIGLQIILKGDHEKHGGSFVGPESHDIILPLLETSAVDIRVKYAD